VQTTFTAEQLADPDVAESGNASKAEFDPKGLLNPGRMG
jgi:hypothetical protein